MLLIHYFLAPLLEQKKGGGGDDVSCPGIWAVFPLLGIILVLNSIMWVAGDFRFSGVVKHRAVFGVVVFKPLQSLGCLFRCNRKEYLFCL